MKIALRAGSVPGTTKSPQHFTLLLAAACLIPLAQTETRARPFRPQRDNQVLERLETRPGQDSTSLRQSEESLRKNPANANLAADVAERYLEQYRAEGNPRALSYAETALRPWASEREPPERILLLRAWIKQSNHQFAEALDDLALLLKRFPNNAQGWLLRSTVLQVLGRYAEARQAAWALARINHELPAVTCAAALSSLVGQAGQSFLSLKRSLDLSTNAPVAEKLWALTVLAEIAARRGDSNQAEVLFQEALGLGKRNLYLLGAYADFLLDQGKPAAVIQLLREETRVDGLLLRLALAEKEIPEQKVQLREHLSALTERFAASRARGDTLHQREEARFLLHLCNQPEKALPLVRANWEIQKEPADLRLLLEASIAGRDGGTASRALAWVRQNQLEDVQIDRLVRLWETRSSTN